jgi:hypothetical protein
MSTEPTLQEYILVSQHEYFIEQFIRKDSGKWEYGSYKGTNQVLTVESVQCELPMSEIYWDIEFESGLGRGSGVGKVGPVGGRTKLTI